MNDRGQSEPSHFDAPDDANRPESRLYEEFMKLNEVESSNASPSFTQILISFLTLDDFHSR